MAKARKKSNRDEQPLDKTFGLLWDVDPSVNEDFMIELPGEEVRNKVEGPFCPRCNRDLSRIQSETGTSAFVCNKGCGFEKSVPLDLEALRDEVLELHNAKVRAMREVISLDLPPTKIDAQYNEDEDYFLSARITQKDGRKLLVVYAGEKKKGKHDPKDYSQFFIDLDQKQIRYDTGNKMPEEFIATFVCELRDNKTVTEFKKGKK